MTRKNWIAIASAELVRIGRAQGFMQVCHGEAASLHRLSPGAVILINEGGPELRGVHLNVPHSANPKISPYGESVGHYEGGDTLVVDTIGLSDDTYIDNYRTPHTTQLHLIERFKVTNGGKTLEVTIQVDDPGAFNMPWSARQIFHRTRAGGLEEAICAENNFAFEGDAAVAEIPKADRPDF